MAISPLLSLAGTALAPLAQDAVKQITEGLSFHKLLERSESTELDDAGSSRQSQNDFPISVEAAQIEAIRRQPLQELAAYVERLRERFQSAGIDIETAVPLQVGNRGDIQVDGDHPDRAAIEELLENDAQLTSTFRRLASALTHRTTSAQADPTEFRLTLGGSEFSWAFE